MGDIHSGPNSELPLEAGAIPRSVKQIFDTLEGQKAEYSVKVTFLELYNEEITNLLAPEEISKTGIEDKQKKLLPLMEDGKGGVLVRGLEEEIATSVWKLNHYLNLSDFVTKKYELYETQYSLPQTTPATTTDVSVKEEYREETHPPKDVTIKQEEI
ncbi:kinesin-like protein KIN-5C [Helianthus annuus]|uniref:kinesin-like protein KIN-5C n=1 Tax=Helianthus annuus TaxID=4232 RepID=UPI000B900B79|nr:kinesin-like protein KIN-5C [Helianthus annuus]